jgi:small subunit ribosomal protein S4e
MTITKRLEVPGFWPIEKKTKKYTVSLRPGPHSKSSSLTLAVVIRDMLKYAETLKEVRTLLQSGIVLVDKVIRKEPGFPCGLMDIVTIGNESFCLAPSKSGFALLKCQGGTKLKKVVNKTKARLAKTQLHFHDGTTMLSEEACSTGDVVEIDLENGKIKSIAKLEKGAKVIVTKGNNVGKIGTLDKAVIVKSTEPNIAEITIDEKKITLPLGYVFAVGKSKIFGE